MTGDRKGSWELEKKAKVFSKLQVLLCPSHSPMTFWNILCLSAKTQGACWLLELVEDLLALTPCCNLAEFSGFLLPGQPGDTLHSTPGSRKVSS